MFRKFSTRRKTGGGVLIAIDASLQCVRRPTQAFIMAFQHFAARQGLPSVVYINNAFTFKRTSKDLRGIRNVLRNLRFQDHCTQHCFKRKFMAEREVWQGGFWERIEKTVKRCLQLTLEKKKKKKIWLQRNANHSTRGRSHREH